VQLPLNADGKEIDVFARSHEHLLEIRDVVLRLLAVSVVRSVVLNKGNHHRGATLINAPTLAYLMEQCQSLKLLSLNIITLDEHLCRALGAYSRPGLEIELTYCRIAGTAAAVLAQVLGQNKGPTKLDYCYMDNSVLVDGLRGNSCLKSLRPHLGNREVLAIAGALRENKGLDDLDLRFEHKMSDESWGAICRSLKAHPTLEVLHLGSLYRHATTAPAVITSRIQALLDTLKVNVSIHTIHLLDSHSENELFRRSVISYLETNRLRPRLLAIQSQGAGTRASCLTDQSRSVLDAFIRECRSCLSVDDCDDHAGCEPPCTYY
jgi:hypothetical protein